MSTLRLFILNSLFIDCIFSSSFLHFNPTCSIQILILLELVLEMGAFNLTGKKSFFIFDDSVCFYLNHILSNTGIDFVNKFQLIKQYYETALLPNFRFFRISIFGVSYVLSMFHSSLLFLYKHKSWRIPNGLISLIQWSFVRFLCFISVLILSKQVYSTDHRNYKMNGFVCS